MKLKLNICCIAAFIAAVMLAASCGSSRNTAATQPLAGNTVTDPATTFAVMAGSYAPWTTFQAPVRMELSAPMRFTASGTATMVRDSAIGISIKVLGFEVGALYADADSVTILIKVNKMGYTESMDRFTAATGMGIADLQSLLLGQAFTPGAGTITSEAYANCEVLAGDRETAAEEWIFRPRGSRGAVAMSFTATASADASPLLTAIDAEIPGERTITCSYSGHEPTDGGIVAANASIQAALNPLNVNASLRWNLDRARWNNGATPRRLTIPAGYRRVTTAALVQYLRNMNR